MKHIKGIIWWITLPFIGVLGAIVLISENDKAAKNMTKLIEWHNSLAEDEE